MNQWGGGDPEGRGGSRGEGVIHPGLNHPGLQWMEILVACLEPPPSPQWMEILVAWRRGEGGGLPVGHVDDLSSCVHAHVCPDL